MSPNKTMDPGQLSILFCDCWTRGHGHGRGLFKIPGDGYRQIQVSS